MACFACGATRINSSCVGSVAAASRSAGDRKAAILVAALGAGLRGERMPREDKVGAVRAELADHGPGLGEPITVLHEPRNLVS